MCCKTVCFYYIVLQINLNDISKRSLRLTADAETDNSPLFTKLKLIGEELWCCHDGGITVYDCEWNTIREIRLGGWARSVAALDTKTVVIANFRSLVISSTTGLNLRLVIVCKFRSLTGEKLTHNVNF